MLSVLGQWQMWVMGLLPAGIIGLCFRFASRQWSSEASMHTDAAREVAAMYADQRYKDIASLHGLASALRIERVRTRRQIVTSLALGFGVTFLSFVVFPALAHLPSWVTICSGVAGLIGIIVLYNR